MSFKRQNEPARGIATDLLPGIRRIVAPNRGAMTYHGTNTYLVAHEDQVFVLDPGPDDDSHVAVILAATGGSVAGILLTHSHRDHVGAAPALKAATGAPTYGIPGGQVPPDIEIGEGDSVAGLLVLHTPGHAPDHACFCRPDGVVFSGDPVMGWSTTVVSPPHGSMSDYYASLERLLSRSDSCYLPGHGDVLEAPRPYMARLLARRKAREAAILQALRGGAMTAAELAETLYRKVDPELRSAAERNVMAHLIRLQGEGMVRPAGERWMPAATGGADAPAAQPGGGRIRTEQ